MTENTVFRTLDLVPSSYEEREGPTLLRPLESANSETLCFLVI
jgi:hypothetical protein